jgi:hypothetical protein
MMVSQEQSQVLYVQAVALQWDPRWFKLYVHALFDACRINMTFCLFRCVWVVCIWRMHWALLWWCVIDFHMSFCMTPCHLQAGYISCCESFCIIVCVHTCIHFVHVIFVVKIMHVCVIIIILCCPEYLSCTFLAYFSDHSVCVGTLVFLSCVMWSGTGKPVIPSVHSWLHTYLSSRY